MNRTPRPSNRLNASGRPVLRHFSLVAVAILSVMPASADLESTLREAASWLEQNQNPDGSWGASAELRPLVTSEAVIALRASGHRRAPYYRGVSWLENRAMTSVDSQARRITALYAHGDDLTRDIDALLESFSMEGWLGDGWGLSGHYGPSALDSGLALLAFGAIGVSESVLGNVLDAATFLTRAQDEGSDQGWQAAIAADNPTGDPLTTAVVLRGLAAVSSSVSGLQPYGDAARDFLVAAVHDTSPPLHQAHAALAVLRWTPGAATADSWLTSLQSSQTPVGSWDANVYTTAVALQALAAKLGVDAPQLQSAVSLPDLGLRAAINLALGKNRVDAVTRRDMQSLTDLDARDFGIEDLAGIEEAIGLVTLDLRGNPIADVSPVDSLPELATLLIDPTCDPNSDGLINVADVLLTARMVGFELDSFPISKRASVDIAPSSEPDGTLTTADLLLLVRRTKGDALGVCPDS